MKKRRLGIMSSAAENPSSSLRMSRELRHAAYDLRRYAREEAERKANLRSVHRSLRFGNLWGF